MNNPLTDVLTPGVRKALYALLFLAGIVLGALKIADVDTGAAADVIAYVAAALGLTAASNTGTSSPEVQGD
jgi:hypothetical protein